MSKYYKAEDVIRKRAEDLADTSYWEYGNPKNVDEWIEVAEMEFKDLPTIEVSEDCISREVATDIIKKYDFKFPEYMESFVNKLRDAMKEDLVEDIKNAPSVVPKDHSGETTEMVGEWIRDRYWSRGTGMGEEYGFFYKCSLCDYEVEDGYTRCGFNYCPNCGARMKQDEKRKKVCTMNFQGVWCNECTQFWNCDILAGKAKEQVIEE